MESDGGNQHTLLESEWSAGSPDWSPDGFHIVFTLSSGEGQDSQICMIRPDGSDFRILEDAGDGTGPVWSADGKSILFSSNRSGTWQIYSVAPDGNNLIQITDSEINKTNPCPSPDGTMIAYTEPARSIFPAHLRIINQDGSNDRMLSDYQNSREHPCWSTDSKFLFFESARYDNLEIYSVDINGRFLTNISRSPDDELYPAIPGKKLVSGDPDADLESLSGISVWPVPTENILHLRVTDPESTGVKIIVSDPLGRQVLVQQEKIHSTGPQLFTVNLSDLNAGIYHLSILTGQKTFTQSITKL
jgi:Tol biopolymer transport system component